MTQFVILLAILISAGAPLTRADAGQEASATEVLTALERPVRPRSGAAGYVESVLAAYDPTTGKRRELVVQELAISREGRRSVMAPSGDSLLSIAFKPTQSVTRARGGQRSAIPFPANPELHRMIAEGSRPRTLEPSPDGHGWLMRVGQSSLILHHEQTTRMFDLDWIDWDGGDGINETAYSWSPDSRKVAFYYAYAESQGASIAARDFGIALLTLEDGVVELIKPSGRRTDAALGWEAVPPQWSPDSRYVYFIQGPPREERAPQKAYPLFTYRVDITTGQEEQLAQGAVTSVAPDGSYLLVSMYSVVTEAGGIEHRSAKFDLRTRKIELLPPLVGLPRISPSGRYVAAICRDKEQTVVRFFDASDWSMISDAGPIPETESLAEWYTFCRWITLEAPPQPAVPTTQP